MAGRGWTSELLLAKSLPNRSHHKGYAWACESRAILEPLRFSTHERSGVGSESGLAGELFSRFFFLENSATLGFLSLKSVAVFLSRMESS